ncbi:MAG TPA: hypothetical protein VNZ64_02285 [Candidatus Acidoferrum sp.]|jgi:hypothetical protein|nr:hypothetical protein [Candidatus Acidoferrum sp.]
MKTSRIALLIAATATLTLAPLPAPAEPTLLWSSVSGPWNSSFNGSFGAIAVHPTNPNIILLGSTAPGGPGVLKSSDGGATWTAKNSGIQQVGIPAHNYPAITTIVISPSNPTTMYLGTAVDDVILGPLGDVYKSTDGGETWLKVSGSQIIGAVLAFDVYPQNADVAFAGVTGQGILQTSNGGTTWTTIYAAPTSLNTIQYFNIVRVSPTDPNTVIFSTFSDITFGALPLPTEDQIDLSGIIPSPPRKTTDGGANWTPIGSLPQAALFTDLQYEKASGNWYISTIAYATPLPLPEQNFGIFKSTDSAQTWQAINQASFGTLDQMPFVALSANPSSVNKGIFASTGFGNLVVATTDTGTHWLRMDPCLLNAYVGRSALAGNKFFLLTSLGIFFTDISSLYAPPTPTISSVSPTTLPPSSSPQLITITGSNFLLTGDPNASTLVFYDPANNSYTRMPANVTSTSMQYNLNVQSATGKWEVKAVNGTVESSLFTFTVAAVDAQLTGLSISGPANVMQNTSGNQYIANAIMSDGTTPTVTPTWTLSAGAPASISSSGQLTANSVSANTTTTVTASYTYGGVTKTANYNVTISTSSSCGTYVQDLIVNGTFASGTYGWAVTGNFQADSRFTACHSCPGYAYLANSDGTPGNNLSGTLSQTVTIPANATSATLGYYYYITTQDSSTVAFDYLYLNLVLLGGTLVGIDQKSNKDASSGYVWQSFDVSAYKGQTITVRFTATTDTSLPTAFRVDDVSLIVGGPNPVTAVLFGVGGPKSVAQSTTAQYNAIVVNCDNSVQSVTPAWSISSGPASISPSGLLSAGSVSADTAATIHAVYSGFSLDYPITVAHVAPVYTSLAISGPSPITDNSSAQFTATALYSDGSSQVVTPTWSVTSGPGSISTSGSLTVGQLGANATLTVSASYTTGGITKSASQNVDITHVPPPPNLVSLSISGPSSLPENSAAQYSAAATMSDGSSQVVEATWSQNLSSASISALGLFAAGEVVSNTTAVISASYTAGLATMTASNTVTVVNVVPPPPVIGFTLSDNHLIISWLTNFSGFSLEYATSLPATSWTSNAAQPAVVNQQYMLTNPITAGSKFFRLRK